MEKLQKCVNFILTVPVFFATSCIADYYNRLLQVQIKYFDFKFVNTYLASFLPYVTLFAKKLGCRLH
jgi:hypothetical protein